MERATLYTEYHKRLKTFFVPVPVLITSWRNLSEDAKVFEFRNLHLVRNYNILIHEYTVLLVKRAINTHTIYYYTMWCFALISTVRERISTD